MSPLSVKDLIWINVAQGLKISQTYKNKEEEWKAISQYFSIAYGAIADIRAVALDTNLYVRLNAHKGSKEKKIHGYDIKSLPSEKERRAKLTDDERQKEDYEAFMRGETIGG